MLMPDKARQARDARRVKKREAEIQASIADMIFKPRKPGRITLEEYAVIKQHFEPVSEDFRFNEKMKTLIHELWAIMDEESDRPEKMNTGHKALKSEVLMECERLVNGHWAPSTFEAWLKPATSASAYKCPPEAVDALEKALAKRMKGHG
jgi:superoxide dismutase